MTAEYHAMTAAPTRTHRPDPQASFRFRCGLSSRGDDRYSVSHWFHCVILSTSSGRGPIENIDGWSLTETPHMREAVDSDDTDDRPENSKIGAFIQRFSASTRVNVASSPQAPVDDSPNASECDASGVETLFGAAKKAVRERAELSPAQWGQGAGGDCLCSSAGRTAAPSATPSAVRCPRAAGSTSRSSPICSPARPRHNCSSAGAAGRRPRAPSRNRDTAALALPARYPDRLDAACGNRCCQCSGRIEAVEPQDRRSGAPPLPRRRRTRDPPQLAQDQSLTGRLSRHPTNDPANRRVVRPQTGGSYGLAGAPTWSPRGRCAGGSRPRRSRGVPPVFAATPAARPCRCGFWTFGEFSRLSGKIEHRHAGCGAGERR